MFNIFVKFHISLPTSGLKRQGKFIISFFGVQHFWDQKRIKVKNVLGQQNFGSNLLGVPKRNGVSAQWKSEDRLWHMQYF